jgi:Tetracyclin repressor-like, C-terminal domain
MADEGGLVHHARRDLTTAIGNGRFDIADVDLALHITAGSLLGLITLLDARQDLDAGALADQYAVRILRGFGLGRSEAARLASRPLPDVANLA